MSQVQGRSSEPQLKAIGRNLQLIGHFANRFAFQKVLKNFHSKRLFHDGTAPDYLQRSMKSKGVFFGTWWRSKVDPHPVFPTACRGQRRGPLQRI